MPQTTFHTTYSNNPYLFLRTENGSESGLRSAVSYRFGFNGQEMDNEISGQTGTHTTAMFWEYDSRLGRRWNLDPVTYPSQSSYVCFNGNPILFADPLGLFGKKGKAEKSHRKAEEEGLNPSDIEFDGTEYYFNIRKEGNYSVAFFHGKKNFSKKYDKAIERLNMMEYMDACPYEDRINRLAWSKNFNNPNLLKNHQQFNRSYGPGTHAREFDVFGTGLIVAMTAPLAAEFLLPIAVETAPKFAVEYAGWKFIGSSLVQLTINQRVDLFDATLDAFTMPGLSRSVGGGLVDFRLSKDGFTFESFGYNKSIEECLYDSGSRYAFSSFGKLTSDQVGLSVRNGLDNAFYNFGKYYWAPTITNTLNKGIKNEIFKK